MAIHLASGERRILLLEYGKITAVVALYWFVSISLVFLNKYLLSSTDLKLDAPLFVTWFQSIVTVALCIFFGVLGQKWPQWVIFPEFKLDRKISREVLPLSLVFVAMITFNNLCLKHVGVAFYYVGRSLTTVFNVVCTYFILGKTTSCRALICCGVIIGGFLLGVDQEDVAGSLSKLGVVYGVLASLFVALNAIYTKKVLPVVNENVWRLCLYNNINAAIIFIPMIAVSGELPRLFAFENLFALKFWLPMFVSGVFGFGMGYVTGLQIQVTSALTHNISGTAKAAAQTVMAVFWYGDIKTILWWASNSVVLGGSFAYTLVQMADMRDSQSHRRLAPTKGTDE